MNSRVFIPQVPSRFDKSTGLWIPSMDLSAAQLFGDPVHLMPPEAHSNRLPMEAIIAVLKEKMETFGRADFLLCCGAPAISHAAAIIASQKCDGRIRILEWDKFQRGYKAIEINV